MRFLRQYTFAAAALAALLLTAGCLPDLPQREIRDLVRMVQKPTTYLDAVTARQLTEFPALLRNLERNAPEYHRFT